MLLNCGVGEDSWESLRLQGDPISPSWRKSVLNIHWKDWCWSWNSHSLAPWFEEVTHLQRPWDAGKNWRWEEKGTTEDEMIGWHHPLDGHEARLPELVIEWEAWRAAVSGVAESDRTEQLKWLNWYGCIIPNFSLFLSSTFWTFPLTVTQCIFRSISLPAVISTVSEWLILWPHISLSPAWTLTFISSLLHLAILTSHPPFYELKFQGWRHYSTSESPFFDSSLWSSILPAQRLPRNLWVILSGLQVLRPLPSNLSPSVFSSIRLQVRPRIHQFIGSLAHIPNFISIWIFLISISYLYIFISHYEIVFYIY